MKDKHPFAAILPTPFGAIGIQTNINAVSGVVFLPQGTKTKEPESALAAQAVQQVRQYLASPDFHFNLPLAKSGTAFQRRVWHEIAATPTGKTATYGTIAQRLQSAPRAVGQACGANPCPLITPCHRIVRTGGALGGFSGQHDDAHFLLSVKRWLLAHEGIQIG